MEAVMFTIMAILIGMRHGIDGDHVAAIADMVGSEEEKRKRLSLGLMYAFGHGFIVLIIGVLSIWIGLNFSPAVRHWMEICVALTLIVLGLIIIASIFRQQKNYEFKSRLQIIYEAITKLSKRSKPATHVHPALFGVVSAFVIGIIHGIGVESPTQIALITNVVDANHTTAATMQLLLFVIGLLISTICITVCISWGFMKARLQKTLFLVLGSITGIYSLYLGSFMLLDSLKGGF